MCGIIHTVSWARAMDGLSVAHWKCTDCRRRFVLTHTPPDIFVPIYLDAGVRSVDVRETGSDAGPKALKNPMPPPAIEFQCRCGERITAHSWMYGGTTVCHGCKSTMLLALKYNMKQKMHVIVPEYPHKTSSTA
jgi:hypothetical protein